MLQCNHSHSLHSCTFRYYHIASYIQLPLEMETVKASYSGTFSAKGLIDWWLSTSLGRKVY
ncbi:hypothetical protein PUN28_001186 [Cardiocondyla obscurior]|uniref:Uncharacterized protein n=1 Tax=Cardiocondyla obscurior TaxID=286306 RepID=A0AAW2H448_9HYME